MKKKKIINCAVAAAVLLILSVTVTVAWFMNNRQQNMTLTGVVRKSYFESGDGTAEIKRDPQGNITHGPFEIAHPVQLYYFAWLQNRGIFNKGPDNKPLTEPVYFRVSADLDMSGIILPPAGTVENPFIGIFDGENHTISNLLVTNRENLPDTPVDGTAKAQIVGFFGVVGEYSGAATYENATATVKNFCLNNVTVVSEEPKDNQTLIGIAAGYVNGKMENVGVCNSKISVSEGIDLLHGGDMKFISDYTLVGYCTEHFKKQLTVTNVDISDPTVKNETIAGSSSGDDWGDSIPMKDLHDRLSRIFLESLKGKTDLNSYESKYISDIVRPYHYVWVDTPTQHQEKVFETPFTRYKDSIFRGYLPPSRLNSFAGAYSFSRHQTSPDGTTYLYLNSFRDSVHDSNVIYTHHTRDFDSWAISYDAPDPENPGKTITYYLAVSDDRKRLYATTDKNQATQWHYDESSELSFWDPDGTIYYLVGRTSLYVTAVHSGVNSWTVKDGPNGTKNLSFKYVGDYENPHTEKDYSLVWVDHDITKKDGTVIEGNRWSVSRPKTDADTEESDIAKKKAVKIYYQDTDGTQYFMNAYMGDDGMPHLKGEKAPCIETPWLSVDDGGNHWNSPYIDARKLAVEFEGNAYYLKDDLTFTTDPEKAPKWSNAWDAYQPTVFVSPLHAGSKYLHFEKDAAGKGGTWSISSKSDESGAHTKCSVAPAIAWDPEPDWNIDPVNITQIKGQIPEYKRDTEGGSEETPTSGQVTWFPLSIIGWKEPPECVFDGNYLDASPNNTGYVISGGHYKETNYPYQSGDIRVAKYPYSSLSASTDGGGLKVLTRNHLSGGMKVISDSAGSTNVGGTAFENASAKDLHLRKYDSSYGKFSLTLKPGKDICGLHFMNSQISKDNLVTADRVRINGKTFQNYQLPEDCIDFNLKEKGYINFFAGTYYPGNSSFFSLHKIKRNNKHEIESIKEIEIIYGDPKDSSKPYVYQYAGAKNKPLMEEGYEVIFDIDWIRHPDSIVNNAVYYFEIPVNEGEYALGSVKDSDGAYLMYLDISANSRTVDRETITETVTTTVNSYEYPLGVGMTELPQGDPKDRPAADPLDSIFVRLPRLDKSLPVNVLVNRTGSLVSVTGSWPRDTLATHRGPGLTIQSEPEIPVINNSTVTITKTVTTTDQDVDTGEILPTEVKTTTEVFVYGEGKLISHTVDGKEVTGDQQITGGETVIHFHFPAAAPDNDPWLVHDAPAEGEAGFVRRYSATLPETFLPAVIDSVRDGWTLNINGQPFTGPGQFPAEPAA